jgi:hypothetical protein
MRLPARHIKQFKFRDLSWLGQINGAARICGRIKLKSVADDLVLETNELIPTTQINHEKSSEASLKDIVANDLLKENDQLRDRVAELEAKVYTLELVLAAGKWKSWWQKLLGD